MGGVGSLNPEASSKGPQSKGGRGCPAYIPLPCPYYLLFLRRLRTIGLPAPTNTSAQVGRGEITNNAAGPALFRLQPQKTYLAFKGREEIVSRKKSC